VGAKICPLSDACALGDGALERALAREAELRRAVEVAFPRQSVATYGNGSGLL